MNIPKQIHYVWVGSNPLSNETKDTINSWARIMPDYSITEWNETNIDFSSLFIRGAYAVRAYNRVSNYARLQALYQHGGIYFDHDVEVLLSFDPLLEKECFFGFQTLRAEEKHIINNAVIGATPRHPFVKRLLEELDKLEGRKEVGADTGPGLVSNLMRSTGVTTPTPIEQVVDGVTLFPPAYFYPYDWTETFTPDCVTGETHAIHHWAHTWKAAPSLRQKISKKIVRIVAHISTPIAFHIQRIVNSRSRGFHKPAQ